MNRYCYLLVATMMLCIILASCTLPILDPETKPTTTLAPSVAEIPLPAPIDESNPTPLSAIPIEDDLPEQIEITVTREGIDEIFTGTLVVSSRFNYGIYILPGFMFFETDGTDAISPSLDSPFGISIISVDSADPIPADREYNGITYYKERITLGDNVIELGFSYSTGTNEGDFALLRAMTDTICQVYAGVRHVSSHFGYVINVLPGYQFLENDECDVIVYNPPNIIMKIYEVEASKAVPAEEIQNGRFCRYQHINLDDGRIIEVQCSFPDHSEYYDALFMLKAMINTIRLADKHTLTIDM